MSTSTVTTSREAKDDRALLLLVRERGKDADPSFRALYERWKDELFGFLARLLRDDALAEDVLQETFLEVVRSIKAYRGEGHLWGWVRRIAASKALMRLRHEKLRATDELHDESAGGPPASVGARVDLERAFAQLSETSRAVVWLHDVEGFTHEEIAERMGRTVSFSKSQLARAHARLRRLLVVEPEVT